LYVQFHYMCVIVSFTDGNEKTQIILLLTRITSFHVYVLEWYDICMVRCDAQREWHVTGSALSWRIVLSRCDVITIMLWQSFTVKVMLKVISVGTPAIRHVNMKAVFKGVNIVAILWFRYWYQGPAYLYVLL
jgi:hypothetical protein